MEKASKSPVIKKKAVKDTMNFPDAISHLITGEKIRRVEWVDEEEYGILRENFLEIHRSGKFHIWQVSEGDLLATDWVVLK